MKVIRTIFILITAGTPVFSECLAGGLAVVVNKANPTDTLSPAQLRRIILAEVRSWPDHRPVAFINRDPSSNAGKCVLSQVVRMSDAEYRRYLLSVEFRGGEPVTVRMAESAQAAARLVQSSPGAIAVVEASSVEAISSAVKVLKISGKLPGETGYPY